MNETIWLAGHPQFILGLQITVGTTCVLSILGASLIILTYLVYKDLRTTARQLLVNLSVADILVASCHFAGLFYFEQFLPKNTTAPKENKNTLCSVQGGVLMLGTIGSFLWTICLAGYMFTIIVLRQPVLAKRLLIPFYLLCWGLPLVLAIWFGVEGFFGFEESADVAWCYVRKVSPNDSGNPKNIYPEVVGYELWTFTTFIILPILCIATFCSVQCKRASRHGHAIRFQTRVHTVDLKLIFVPLIFLLLRIWSTIIDFPVFFLQKDGNTDFIHSKKGAIVILFAGVGDSAQGFANAILFCALTKSVRNKFYKQLKRCCCWLKCLQDSRFFLWQPMISATDTAIEPTTDLEETLTGPIQTGESQSLLSEDQDTSSYHSVT